MKNINDVEVKEKYQVGISNRFVALDNLGDSKGKGKVVPVPN
jgi:hypothetical protein